MPKFLLLVAATGLAVALALLLLGEEDLHRLDASGTGPIEFVTPFRYAPTANLRGEVVTLRNAGDRPVDLSGWRLSSERGDIYVFPEGVSLGPGESVAIHSGDGDDSASDLYWHARVPVWNDRGGVATLTTREGEVVAAYAYGGCASCAM